MINESCRLNWAEEWLMLIDDCELRAHRLSDSELMTVAAMGNKLAAGRRLTAVESELLDAIWRRAMAKW